MNDVTSVLGAAADVADTIARGAPGPVGIAAKIASLAFKAASDIAGRGEDPVIHIARLLSPKPEVEGVHDEWDEFIKKNFPASRPPPDSFEKRPTDPSMPAVTDEDIYED